jgi:biotin transport system substrate-specific component
MGKHDHRLCNQRRILRISYFSTDYNISVDCKPFANFSVDLRRTGAVYSGTDALQNEKTEGKLTMKDKKLTTYQMAVTAVMAAVLCVLGPLTVPIGAVPISLANFVICLTAWLLGPKFGTLSVVIYLALGAIGIPVFSGYGAGLAKLAGPTGGYLVGYLLLAFIGGMFIEKSKGNPVVSAVGLVLGDAACYVLGTAWFVFQMQCELGYALTVCVYPFIALDLAKIVVSCIVGALLRKRLTQAGVLKLQNAVSE